MGSGAARFCGEIKGLECALAGPGDRARGGQNNARSWPDERRARKIPGARGGQNRRRAGTVGIYVIRPAATDTLRNMKHQTPNIKLQGNRNHQTCKRFWVHWPDLGFGVWSFTEVWSLKFGVFDRAVAARGTVD